MSWTAEKPKTKGLYWMLYPKEHPIWSMGGGLHVVEVDFDENTGAWKYWDIGWDIPTYSEHMGDEGVQWLPVTLPELP